MERRRLGRSELEVSPVGLGCWAIGGPFEVRSEGYVGPMGWGAVDDGESIRAIRVALDLGINLFDTASNYGAGHSEEVLGRALQGRREGVVIATKFGSVVDPNQRAHVGSSADPAYIRESCEASLRRLRTDAIDLFQFHWGDFDPSGAPDVIEVLEDLVAAGKVRWYGWSTDLPDRAAAFADAPHMTAVQFEVNVLREASEMIGLCETHDWAGLVKRPLSSGLLTGKYDASSRFPDDDGRRSWQLDSPSSARLLEVVEDLRPLLTVGGRTMAEGAIAWVLARSERLVPIPGFKTERQVRDNAAVLRRGPLSAAEAAAARALVPKPRDE